MLLLCQLLAWELLKPLVFVDCPTIRVYSYHSALCVWKQANPIPMFQKIVSPENFFAVEAYIVAALTISSILLLTKYLPGFTALAACWSKPTSNFRTWILLKPSLHHCNSLSAGIYSSMLIVPISCMRLGPHSCVVLMEPQVVHRYRLVKLCWFGTLVAGAPAVIKSSGDTHTSNFHNPLLGIGHCCKNDRCWLQAKVSR